MRVAVGELVERADVVEVVVRRDRGERLVEEITRGFGEAHDAEPGVDEHRPLATAHEPHVAVQERVRVLFPEMPRAIVDLPAGEPFAGGSEHDQDRRSRRGRNVTVAPVEMRASSTLGAGGAGSAAGSIVIVHARRSSSAARRVCSKRARLIARAISSSAGDGSCAIDANQESSSGSWKHGRVAQREANGPLVEHLDHRRDVRARLEDRMELEQLGDRFGVVAL